MKIVVEYDEKETNSVKELIRVYNHKLGGKKEEEARRTSPRSVWSETISVPSRS